MWNYSYICVILNWFLEALFVITTECFVSSIICMFLTCIAYGSNIYEIPILKYDSASMVVVWKSSKLLF